MSPRMLQQTSCNRIGKAEKWLLSILSVRAAKRFICVWCLGRETPCEVAGRWCEKILLSALPGCLEG